MKPLGGKAYGSIPHLPGSRMGPGDHHCHEGQERICTEKARDGRDVIWVQEKLDGSCVAVANVDGQIIALGRAGYLAETSPHEQHHLFAAWVTENRGRFANLLQPGERVVGEWLAQAHGTRYDFDLTGAEPFVAFDIMRGKQRLPMEWMIERCWAVKLEVPATLGSGPMTVERAQKLGGVYGFHGALDPIEGFVWRVERDDKVDFLAKWVRPDKVDGCYLPEVSGKDAVWNWRPSLEGATA